MRNDSNVFSIFNADVLDRDKLQDIMERMVEKVNASEPSTLNYEWTVSEDGKTLSVYERYTGSDTMLSHVQGFGDFAEDFMAAVKPTGFSIYGQASDELKATLSGFAPTYFERLGGFVR